MSPQRDLVAERAEICKRILRNVKEEVLRSKLYGRSENEFKNSILDIIRCLEEELELIIEEIRNVGDIDTRLHRSELIIRILEEFMFEIMMVTRQSREIPLEMYYFTELVADDLGISGIRYLLVTGRELCTTNFSQGLYRLFSSLPATSELIRSNCRFFWIIFVPPALTNNVTDWPLLIHELGHIIEEQLWNIVDQFYPLQVIYRSPVSDYLEPLIKYRYAKEYLADYIATCYIGPVFLYRTLLGYYRREIHISPDHPSWDERMKAMREWLEQNGLTLEEQYTPDLQGMPRESSLIPKERIEHLPEIINQASELLTPYMYHPDAKAEEKAMQRLKMLVPYTDDLKVLCNVAEKAKAKLLNQYSNDEKARFEKEFDYILMDSIRLRYLRTIFEPVLNPSSG